jgi:acyl carrier protein
VATGENKTLRDDIQPWLLNWFASRSKIRTGETHSLDIDYFAAGWLTSMEVVEFVTDIETQFGMQFTDRDLQEARFATIAGLVELVSEHLMQAGENVARQA